MSAIFVGFAADGDELSWLFDSSWTTLAMLVMVAVTVLLVGGMLSRNAEQRRAKGRRNADFDLEVAKMERLGRTDIASLAAGPAHVEGIVHSSVGVLGGEPGHECVYRNRAGSDRSTAVGSELIVVADASGRVAVEQLEKARVLAPRRADGPHETISLHVGDRVQVLGVFSPEVSGEGDPSTRVYGSFGTDGAVQVKVLPALDRAAPPAPKPSDTDPATDTP